MQTLALLMTGIFSSRDVRLSRIAEQIPLDIQEDSVAQRFRRWLKNPHLDERAIYDPVARQLLVSLRHTRLRLQIDRTMIDDRFNVLMVSLAYRRRAIPLVWIVLPHLGNSTFMEREEILSHVAELLPAGSMLLILGDREFGTPDMMLWVLKSPSAGDSSVKQPFDIHDATRMVQRLIRGIFTAQPSWISRP
jgi:hypothetical protein